MKVFLSFAFLFFSTLLWGEEGIEISGSGYPWGSTVETLERIKKEAVLKGLYRYLSSLLTYQEMEEYEDFLQKEVKEKQEQFVKEVTQEIWGVDKDGKFFYKAQLILNKKSFNKILLDMGVMDPFDRYISLSPAPETEKSFLYGDEVVKEFFDTMRKMGVVTDPEGEGMYTLKVRKEFIPHPFAREITVERIALDLEIQYGNRLITRTIYSPSDPFSPPFTAQVADLVEDLYRERGRLYSQEGEKSWITLGPLLFPDEKSFLKFHRKIVGRSRLFPRIYPLRITKRGSGWEVEYRFVIPPGEEINAQTFLQNELSVPIVRKGNRWHP